MIPIQRLEALRQDMKRLVPHTIPMELKRSSLAATAALISFQV